MFEQKPSPSSLQNPADLKPEWKTCQPQRQTKKHGRFWLPPLSNRKAAPKYNAAFTVYPDRCFSSNLSGPTPARPWSNLQVLQVKVAVKPGDVRMSGVTEYDMITHTTHPSFRGNTFNITIDVHETWDAVDSFANQEVDLVHGSHTRNYHGIGCGRFVCWAKKSHDHTWNPNDPCFGWKRPCFGGLPSKIEVIWVLGMHISPLNNCHLAISLLLSCWHTVPQSSLRTHVRPTFPFKWG